MLGPSVRCREVIHGTDPVVRYNYTESGNYTLRLQVGANMTQQLTPIAGVYSMDVKVLGRLICFLSACSFYAQSVRLLL